MTEHCQAPISVEQDGATCFIGCGRAPDRYVWLMDYGVIYGLCPDHDKDPSDYFKGSCRLVSYEEALAGEVHLL